MTAAVNSRATRTLATGPVVADPPAVPVAAAQYIHDGTLVMADASGNATGAAAAGQTCLGMANQDVDNSAGLAGAKTVLVRRGCFSWANDPADPVVAADRYKTVYMTDNQTVSHTAAGKSAVGKFLGFDPADGTSVLVETL